MKIAVIIPPGYDAEAMAAKLIRALHGETLAQYVERLEREAAETQAEEA